MTGALALLACALALAAALPAGAAGRPGTYSGSLFVQSTPAGGTVHLTGPLRAAGLAPFHAPDFPVGAYRVAVSRKGYYTRHSSVVLAAGDSVTISAALRPKSRVMGFARSVILPGWGQSFNERPGRALFYLTTEIAAAGAATYLATQYNHSVTRYERIADSLQAAATVAEIERYNAKLADHEAAWRAHYDDAKTAAFVAAGIWALAAVDALVFGPVREDLPMRISLDAAPASLLGSLETSPSHPASASRLAVTVHF